MGRLGRVLGGLGVVLGDLGAILGGLGGSWGGLGRFWGGLGAILARHVEQPNFRSIFGSILVAERVPTGRLYRSQNGAKIDPKTRSKFKSEKVTSWKRLGSILGRFGGVPGGHFY